MPIDYILYIAALISMGLHALTVNTGRVNTQSLAFAFLIATLVV